MTSLRHASDWNLASQHFPERDTQRIQIRADVDCDSSELIGTGKAISGNLHDTRLLSFNRRSSSRYLDAGRFVRSRYSIR